jgi:hypothetical protein
MSELLISDTESYVVNNYLNEPPPTIIRLLKLNAMNRKAYSQFKYECYISTNLESFHLTNFSEYPILFPSDIINCINLKELIISNVKLYVVHTMNHIYFTLFKKSIKEDVRGFQRTESKLPLNICNLILLERLVINFTRLESIPNTFGQLFNLKELSL